MSLLPSILTWAGMVALLLAAGWMIVIIARRSGRAEAERDQAAQSAEHGRKRHEIDEDVARLSGPELDRELFGPKR